MFKIKQILSGCMAAVLLLTMSVTAFATDATYDGIAYGEYTVEVSYLKTNANEGSSMAGYMASNILPVTVDENGYTVSMDFYNYYAANGVTALENLKYDVDSTWIDLDLVNVADEYAGYTNASFYDRATVAVDSLDDLILQAYVIPMPEAYATQSWRVVFDTDTLTAAGVTTDSMTITASVAKNVATSSVVIPESMAMGTLSKTDDTSIDYTVEINEGYGQTVTVTSEDFVELTAGASTLTIANNFDGENGTLTVSANDVADVASNESDLNFTGSLSFTISVS